MAGVEVVASGELVREYRDKPILIRATKSFKDQVVEHAAEKQMSVSTFGNIALQMLMDSEKRNRPLKRG